MNVTDRAALLARYAEGPQALEDAVAAVPQDALDRSVIAGEWTPRQIVHHVADSETMSYIRLRRLQAEDHPVIQGYDEAEFARRLHYDRPIEAALAVVRAVRVASAELLATLSEDEWAREGTHSDSGRYTMDDWLRIYVAHCHDHADQIRRVAGA
ncbi:MAG: DinB family protein [Ktedonobacterales bacterium]|nr:DinB family protein [Ktedonobacterales bacterium]